MIITSIIYGFTILINDSKDDNQAQQDVRSLRLKGIKKKKKKYHSSYDKILEEDTGRVQTNSSNSR